MSSASPGAPDFQGHPWHALEAAALRLLGTESGGLTEAEAARRLACFGANVPPRPRRAGPVVIYLRQFETPLVDPRLVFVELFKHWARGRSLRHVKRGGG